MKNLLDEEVMPGPDSTARLETFLMEKIYPKLSEVNKGEIYRARKEGLSMKAAFERVGVSYLICERGGRRFRP